MAHKATPLKWFSAGSLYEMKIYEVVQLHPVQVLAPSINNR